MTTPTTPHHGPAPRRDDAPRLSVIVPTKNSARTLDRCLRSIRAQRAEQGNEFAVELIVIDNRSDDATPDIARALADVFEDHGPERCAQRNRGLERASAPHVLFIDSDMTLQPTVCADVERALRRAGVGGVIVPEISFGDGFWASCRALEKRIAIGDARTEAARGFAVATLEELGAWNEDLTAAEDWDLTDRIRANGREVARVDALILHDEGHPTLRATFRKKRYYGQWMAGYLGSPTSNERGDAAQRRRRLSPLRILRRPGLLLQRPDLAVGLFVLKFTDALGIALGSLAAQRAAAPATVAMRT